MADTTMTMEPAAGNATSLLIGRSLLEIAWKRKAFIGLGVLVGLILGILFFTQARPVYQSKAQVLVVKKRPDNVTGMDTRNLAIEDYVATHQTLLKSPLIVERAVKKKNLGALECFAGEEDVTETILLSLTVARTRAAGPTASNVLDLAFRGGKADECPIVLNAIIDSYKDFLDETYRNISEDTLKLVVQARDVLQKDLMKQEIAYRTFRTEAPILLLRGKDGTNLTQERLSSIEAKRSALLVRKAELQGYLQAIENSQKKGSGREALLSMVAHWTARMENEGTPTTERMSLQNQLYPLLQEEQKLLETRGANHPEVQYLRKRIEMTRNFLAGPSAPWRQGSDTPGSKETAADPVELYRVYFTQQLNHLEISEKLLKDLFKEEFDTAKALASYDMKDEAFRVDIDRTQKLYDSIIKRLQEVDLIKDVGGYDARNIAPPAIGKKVAPSALMIFPAALLLGGLGGFALAYLAEVTDKTFRNVDEVRQRLGLPVVGQIPYLPEARKAGKETEANKPMLSPVLYAHHHPKSMEAESYRGVRTALYFNVRGKGLKVVQVTSPNVGDGKSTLAANLAISIAQSGKRVLLIDADMRKPTMHKLFGISSKVGLSSVIVEEAEPKEAIQASEVDGLALLPCGPIPPNPSELLTSPRFEEFLQLMREQFDFVIVDTPPLLVVTDPSVVAHKADGVLLNILFTKNGRPEAERAREILHNLKANVIGVVINDAEQILKSTGYGYGYEYGYSKDYHQPVSENGQPREDQLQNQG